MVSTGITGEHHDSHHINSKEFVGFFCGCWRIFRHTGQREAKPSLLLSNDVEENY